MRLTCPNCGAQYEVPDNVIPEAGRDVQCSNCGHTWFQQHPDDIAAAQSALDTQETYLDEPGLPEPEPVEPPGEAQAETPQRKQLDPSIAEVLREEAEREARAREAERGGGLESQPDLGLQDPEDEHSRRARQARDRMARMRGLPEEPEPETAAPGEGPSSRRDLLPDIDEINSSLRAASDRRPAAADDHATPGDLPEIAPAPRGGGFRRGFFLALLVAAILWLLYLYAAPIAAKVPALKPLLTSYVAVVDQLRDALNQKAQELIIKLEAAGKS